MTAVGQRFEVFAPATVANVGPGFDCFGFSLGEPGDTVSVAVTDTPGVRITDLQCDFGDLPIQAELNTAGRAAIHIWSSAPETAAKHGLDMTLHKGLPLCSGLGSSAASAVAGAVAAMHALAASTGAQYDPQKVLDAAFDGESLASGTPHADNIAPALYGGFTIVQSAHPLRIARFEPSLPCRVALVTPDWEISTKHARVILPDQVPLRDAVSNWANTASIVLALMTADAELLRHAMNDRIVEPRRGKMLPGYEQAKQAAIDAGAYGCSISGSGPTMFALTPDEPTAQRACDAMAKAFAHSGLQSTERISFINPKGAGLI